MELICCLWATMPATGVYTLYFVVTDNANGCSRTESIRVTAFPVTAANAGRDLTDAATCGLSQVTLAANTPICWQGQLEYRDGHQRRFLGY